MRTAFSALFAAVSLFAAACNDGGAAEGEGEGEGEAGEGEGEGEGGDGRLLESEPNDGSTLDEVDAISVGDIVGGVVDGADDVDVFALGGVVAGRVYKIDAVDFDGSGFTPRVVVFDDGRGGAAPGEDYVRISTPVGPGAVILEFAALGGSVLIAVEDDVGAGGPYSLVVSDATDEVTEAGLSGGAVDGALDHAGAVALYPFDAAAGDEVVFDLVAADLDARLFVVSGATGDWIARNDDRSIDDVNPLIDAPLFEEGPYFLLVENIAAAPASLGFTLTATLP